MKLFTLFFAFLLGFLFLIIALWLIPPKEGTTGITHPEYQTMQKSGPNQIHNPQVKWLGFGFGFFTVGVLCFCLLVGARKNERLGKVRTWLTFGILTYLVVYCMMIWSYWNYVEGINTQTYFGYFPAPSAWMMYGMFFTPCIFVFIYVFGFNQWVLTKEDMERFHQLLAEK